MKWEDEFVANCRRKIEAEARAAKLLKRNIKKYNRLAFDDDEVAKRQEIRIKRQKVHEALAEKLSEWCRRVTDRR
jgi:hypothetical protein